MDVSLASLEEGLRQPFDVQEVKFLPKSPTKKENGEWVCLALPYSDKRAYEDRLNALAFGHWSTPPTLPIVAGNKLVICVTVVLCGVARTDYGEASLTSQSRNGDVREEENSATEAYSQAFRRACAQFRLGRYYYDLPKIWVPYDAQKRVISLSDAKKRTLAERLYHEAGILLPAPALPGQAPPAEKAATTSSPTVPLDDGIRERLNALYPRIKTLGLCSDVQTFLAHASHVLNVQGLSAKTLTHTQLDLLEKDLVGREQQASPEYSSTPQ